MVVNGLLKRASVEETDFILSAVYVCPPALLSIFVLVILWIVRKTKVVRSATIPAVPFSSNYTYNKIRENRYDNMSVIK